MIWTASRSQRPKASSPVPGQAKLRPAQTISEKMIKVDHAGENGAVNIYRAQRLVARVRSPSLLDQLAHFQSHEEAHRLQFESYLQANGIRRCVSYHLCGIGGFALGIVSGIVGPSAVMATTFAVENVVLEHLQTQSTFLKKNDIAAYDCVRAIIVDEQEHHDHAFENLDANQIQNSIWIKIVKFCTESVIGFGMR